MKAIKCVLIGNTRWGHVFQPEEFESINKAKQAARKMVDYGFWWDYRIIRK